jgi:hypothetical protein
MMQDSLFKCYNAESRSLNIPQRTTGCGPCTSACGHAGNKSPPMIYLILAVVVDQYDVARLRAVCRHHSHLARYDSQCLS